MPLWYSSSYPYAGVLILASNTSMFCSNYCLSPALWDDMILVSSSCVLVLMSFVAFHAISLMVIFGVGEFCDHRSRGNGWKSNVYHIPWYLP